MTTKVSVEDRRTARRHIRRLKELKAEMKPLEKEYEEKHEWVKAKVLESGKDFNFPDGGTSSFPVTRESYDLKMLDEMIDNGTFDSDTAALIRKCRKTSTSITTRVI